VADLCPGLGYVSTAASEHDERNSALLWVLPTRKALEELEILSQGHGIAPFGWVGATLR